MHKVEYSEQHLKCPLKKIIPNSHLYRFPFTDFCAKPANKKRHYTIIETEGKKHTNTITISNFTILMSYHAIHTTDKERNETFFSVKRKLQDGFNKHYKGAVIIYAICLFE